MKMKYLFLACGMAALFAACQNENEPKAVSDKPGTSGDYRIIIEGEETDAQTSRSSGTIQFVGGTASGAGLYDGVGRAFVSATPDPGYEINYFYGGPDSEPKKYDNANGGATSFDVPINGQDHLFHVGFKKKTGSLTINAGTGGTVSPNGQVAIQREVPFSIKATPNSGYEFAGWTVNNGSVTIDNANSTSTTATLNSASGTITAQFKQKEELVINISIVQRVKATGEKVVAPITAIYDNGNGDKGYFNKDNNDNLVATVKQNTEISLIPNGLRLIYTCSLLLALPCIFHTGRHTAATLLLFYKIPLTTIQSILGHTHITTTEIYAEQNEATIYNSIKGVKFKEFI